MAIKARSPIVVSPLADRPGTPFDLAPSGDSASIPRRMDVASSGSGLMGASGMTDLSTDLGARIVAATRLAVALHMGSKVEQITERGQRLAIGGAGPVWFTDEPQPLPASIAPFERSSHN